MAAFTGIYRALTSAELSAMTTEFETLKTAISTGNQSVSRGGISYTRADLPTVLQTLGELYYARLIRGGTVPSTTYADFE